MGTGIGGGAILDGKIVEGFGHTEMGHIIIIAYYLAQALVNYTLILRSEKIILGGGVMDQPRMIDFVREEFSLLLANYVEPRIWFPTL